jgi:hypothetical protein
LSEAFWPVIVITEAITSSIRNGTVSISSRPASILEKSRMSLVIPSRETPAL